MAGQKLGECIARNPGYASQFHKNSNPGPVADPPGFPEPCLSREAGTPMVSDILCIGTDLSKLKTIEPNYRGLSP